VTEVEPQRGEDERELADLREREPGLERDPTAVALGDQQHAHEQWLRREHECRQHERQRQLRRGVARLELRPQVDEEEQEQHVAQRHEPGRDRVAIRRPRKRHTGDERAHLVTEPHFLTDRGQRDRPGEREEQQQIGLASERVHDRPEHPARQRGDHDEEDQAPGCDAHQCLRERAPLLPGRRDPDQHEDDEQVLHDEDPDREPPVQLVDLLAVREELDDHDRARERKPDPDVERGHERHAEGEGEQQAGGRDDDDLHDARHERDRPERAHDVEVEA
jgi:hypothetical protein